MSTAVTLWGNIGDLRITAVGWVLPLVISLFCAICNADSKHVITLKIWIPWSLFVIFTALFSDHGNAILRGIILLTPIVVGNVISMYHSEPDDIREYMAFAATLAAFGLVLLGCKALTGDSERHFFLAAESMTTTVLAWIFIHHYFLFRKKYALLLFVLMLSVPILSTSRTATAVSISAIVLTLVPLNLKLRLVLLCCLAVVAAAVFSSPAFKNKMLVQGAKIGGTTEFKDVVQTSGRLKAWDMLIDEIPNALWLGHGSNSTQTFLQAQIDSFDHPHNDWLRLLYEYGLIGTALFLVTVLIQVRTLIRMAKASVSMHGRFACYTAASLFIPFCILMITDNIILYAAYFGNIHFILIGLSYAQYRAEQERQLSSSVGSSTMLPAKLTENLC